MPVSSSDNAMMAKVHSLYGKRLNREAYENLLQKRTVAEIAGYLKNETYFSGSLSEVKEDLVRREQLESLIERYTLDIYLRLSKYSYGDKLFFIMYRMKSEINQLLFAMRLLNAGDMNKFIVAMPAYLAKHLTFDLFALAKSKSYDDVLSVVEHSEYYGIIGRFRPPTADTPVNIPACESALLTYYYSRLLDMAREGYKGETRHNLERILFYQIDFHNVSLIYRMKKFFGDMSRTAAGYLLPVRAKINPKVYAEMLDAPDIPALAAVMDRHKTDWLFPSDSLDGSGEQIVFKSQRLSKKLAQRIFRFSFEPVIAVVCYMTLLEIEINNITNIIEGVRYGLSPDEIRAMLVI